MIMLHNHYLLSYIQKIQRTKKVPGGKTHILYFIVPGTIETHAANHNTFDAFNKFLLKIAIKKNIHRGSALVLIFSSSFVVTV